MRGVLDTVAGLELDIVESAVDFLHPAKIDVLDDIARVRIDLDRAPGTGDLHALCGVDEELAGGVAVGLVERLVDQVKRIPALS